MRSGGRYAARHAEPSKAPSPLDKKPINEIWANYAKHKDKTTRNYLMEKFLPLVRYNAERIHTRLPDEVDIEDLMSAGVFGLMDAIDAFDLERKVKFETYCAPRIRGAILDELRSMDWVPRLVRHRTNKVDQARQQIEKSTGQPATDDQVAQMLGVNSDEFTKLKRDSEAKSTRSLSQRTFASDGGREVREIDVIRDETQSNPLSDMQRRDMKELITKGLSRAERLIVVLYYYEGMTMKEIGATLDLSESRVSQMHSSILARLKAQMQYRMRELEPVE
ncbi:MAG: FliA/WhiG family RNA polymerase sigma factor [Tepidisphaera sp.]|nr:FliA/WhiG family RNA polymerase sigma factor [Tepidisphaera sp.]